MSILPPCLHRPGKAQKVDEVIKIITDNPDITFKALHGLVKQTLGVSSSTAYEYLREAKARLEHHTT